MADEPRTRVRDAVTFEVFLECRVARVCRREARIVSSSVAFQTDLACAMVVGCSLRRVTLGRGMDP